MQKLNIQQEKALEIIKSGANVYLGGVGGTGKSYVINTYIDSLTPYERDRTLITAPTGIAAININGVTLHRCFGASTTPKAPNDRQESPSVIKMISKADRIIIDEISMCRLDLFSFVCNTLKYVERTYRKRIQLIVIGDFLQLPPVVTDKDRIALKELGWGDIGNGFAFLSPAWNEMKFANVMLTEVVRMQGDTAFIENANKARVNDFSCIPWFNVNAAKKEREDAICLCPTNKQVSEINNINIAKFSTKTTFKCIYRGQVDKQSIPVEDTVELAKGMRVMTVVNDSNNMYQNGSMGTVCGIKNGTVSVKLDTTNEIVEIQPYKWEICNYKIENGVINKEVIGVYKQIPLKHAYALSIHKSQGKTFENVTIFPNCFTAGQLYVAISRCKNIKGVFFKGAIKPNNLITSEVALKFYDYINKNNAI